MITNCKNCGAPLKSHKCEYCGTNYTKQDCNTYDFIKYSEYLNNEAKKVIDYTEYVQKNMNDFIETYYIQKR